MRTKVACSLLVFAILASCAGLPEPGAEVSAGAWVSAQQALVAKLEVDRLPVLRAQAASVPGLAEAARRTEKLWVSLPLTGDEASTVRLSLDGARLALEGDLPRLAVAWALFWNPPPTGWRVIQPRDGLVLVEHTAADTLSTRLVPPLSPVEDALWAKADVRLTLKQPAPLLLGALAGRLFSVDSLDLDLQAKGADLSGKLLLNLPDSRAAAVGLVLLALTGSLLDDKLGQNLSWSAEAATLVGQPFVVPQAEAVSWARNLLGPSPGAP
ncbi:MAG: hypothetical protein WCG80_00365 [Spirochaetales bacterium]